MPQKILYFRTTIKILPVLVRLVVADKPLFTVTGNGPLHHAQKLRKVTVIQQGVAVQAVFQAVHTVKFLFKAIKTFHHSHDHFLKYLIIYIHHGISSIVLKSDYLKTDGMDRQSGSMHYDGYLSKEVAYFAQHGKNPVQQDRQENLLPEKRHRHIHGRSVTKRKQLNKEIWHMTY